MTSIWADRVRIHIDHATTYAYDRPARFIIQSLRLTPRPSEAQQVRHWAVETDVDARLRRSEAAFGNIVHTLYPKQPTQPRSSIQASAQACAASWSSRSRRNRWPDT